mgnify:CR=1 FL=1
MKIKTEQISLPILKDKEINLYIKRLDLVHQHVSGNKWYKLKYNIIEAKSQLKDTLLTFGGAYSNHLAATSFAAKLNGFKSIGIIRGEKNHQLNPTLIFAKSNGMDLHYLSRSDYRKKHTEELILKLNKKFGDFYLIPEGGLNAQAIQGASEILEKNDVQDFICCAVGTGATMTGIINSSSANQNIIGFPVVKDFERLENIVKEYSNKRNFKFINNYLCGGYAKITNKLVDFIVDFNIIHKIPLDAVYTGKMMMGILDLVNKDYFPKRSNILVIHSGGLQGNQGMNNRFGLNLPHDF